MKKPIVLIISMALCLGLCACGSEAATEPSVGDLMYEQYKSIIDHLAAEEYEDAIAEIQTMMPEPEEMVINITPENFYDYYELVFLDSHITRDAAGAVVEIWGNKAFRFDMKEEFASRLISDTNVEVGVTADVVVKKVGNIDWTNGTFSLSDEIYDNIETELAKQFSVNQNETSFPDLSSTYTGTVRLTGAGTNALGMGFFYPYTEEYFHQTYMRQGSIKPGMDENEIYIAVPENIQITRAEGTVTLMG